MYTPQQLGLTKAAYSVDETLNLLSLGRTTLYGLVKNGKLTQTKYKTKTLFLSVDIANFLSALQDNGK